MKSYFMTYFCHVLGHGFASLKLILWNV